jgi:hypothetical protein
VTPNEYGTCPQGCAPLCVCASPDTAIATPQGEQPIERLKAGDLVYSMDRGRLAVVPIARTHRSPVENHRVVRLVLSAGRVLEISPRHPTADGRTFGDLKRGDRLDGVGIASASVIAYTHDATYDILPASDTGTYFAAGVLIGSTLSPAAPLVTEVSAPECVSRD